MRAVLDTSVLIGAEDPGALEGAISAASLAELHFGVLVARDEDERARRAVRLGVIESTFEPLPSTPRSLASGDAWPPPCMPAAASRAAVLDLAIAATANANQVPLLIRNGSDRRLIADLVDARAPE